MSHPRWNLQSLLVGSGMLWLVAVGTIVALSLQSSSTVAQPAKKAPPVPPKAPAAAPKESEDVQFTDLVKLPEDRSAIRKIEEIKSRLTSDKPEDWNQAIELLQSILDQKEEVFFENGQGRWASVWAEANRILGGMSPNQLQFYELAYGGTARSLLKQAKRTGDLELIDEVARRYMHTEAGVEAAELQGTYLLDRGQYSLAAECYKRLLGRRDLLNKVSPLTLFKAAMAFERAGDPGNRDRVWNEFTRRYRGRGQEPLPPLLRRMDASRLRALLPIPEKLRTAHGQFDWPVFLGSPDRAAQTTGGAPFLEPAYRFSLFVEREGHYQAANQASLWVQEAVATQKRQNKAVLSGFHPIAHGDRLFFRSYYGVHVVDMKTGEELWPNILTKMSLQYLANNMNALDGNRNTLTVWRDQYRQTAPYVFYENSTLGTLSTDGQRLYVVEDLAIPPLPTMLDFRFRRSRFPVSDGLAPWLEHNQLTCFSLAQQGLTIWTLPMAQDPADPLKDAFFLGPPLPLAGKLYVLAEVDSDIRLLCLDPDKIWDDIDGKQVPLSQGGLVWSKTLCSVERRIAHDPVRRIHAAHLSYGDGILICPTNAGVVLAVDLLTRSLVWAHSYQVLSETQSVPLQAMGRIGANIRLSMPPTVMGSSAPVVRQGRVVFAAPDGHAVHCLNLRTGKLMWQEKRRDGDLYLAGVYDGKVVIVGKHACRAIDLDTGKLQWRVETGLPSGRGVANATTYFLPLESAEVWAIDLASGTVRGKSRSPAGVVPGNLIFHEGFVISQSPTELVAFPQLAVREREVSMRLAKNPNDPVGLTDRGELRMHKGDLAGAIEDLRQALANNPPPDNLVRAREKLYEALAEYLDRDFSAGEKYLEQFRQLTEIPPAPDETPEQRVARQERERDRQARYYRLVAKGRERQGRFLDAFEAYLDFAELGRDELVALPDDPSTKANPRVWAQGGIAKLLRQAKPQQREALNHAIATQWQVAKNAGTIEALQSFVDLFGPICEPGHEARLLLAEKLMAVGRSAEAEVELQILAMEKDSSFVPKALEALARLHTQLGQLESAAAFYRDLAKRFPSTVIRDGKTGEELYLELWTDKRFLPYLEALRRGWLSNGAIKVRIPSNARSPVTLASEFTWYDPADSVPAVFQRFRLRVHNRKNRAALVDRVTGVERGSFRVRSHRLYRAGLYQLRASSKHRPRFYLSGQVLVFAWGPIVYAYNLNELIQRSPHTTPQPLWEYDLVGDQGLISSSSRSGRGVAPQLLLNSKGLLELVYADQTRELVGRLAGVDSRSVYLLARGEGLVVVDPLRVDPKTHQPIKRWINRQVPMSSALFGDGEHLVVVPPSRASGKAAEGMVLRTADGAPVECPEFASRFQKKIKTSGTCILLADEDESSGLDLQLYDVLTGSDRWTRRFPGGSRILETRNENFVAVLEPTGKVTVATVDGGEVVLEAALDRQITNDLVAAYLLVDPNQFYVVTQQRDPEPEPGTRREIRPPGRMLDNIRVHGPIYAFDRRTGEELWHTSVEPQVLILDQFEDLPLLLFACYQIELRRPPNLGRGQFRGFGQQYSSRVMALDKRTGARIEIPPEMAELKRGNLQLQTIRVDRRAGIVELIGYHTNRRRPYRLEFFVASKDGRQQGLLPRPRRSLASARDGADN